MTFRKSLRTLALSAPLLLATLLAAPAHAVNPAGPAPQFQLPSMAGKDVNLAQYKGQVVMINFWASWCGACRQAMPALNGLDEKYRRAGLVLLSINIDDETHRAEQMALGLKIRFPVLRDEQKVVSRLYQADTMPLTVLIDREGMVRYSHVGYNLGDEHKYQTELRTLLNE
jgi:thiol-disulfide isomerase/thioredoxin